MFKFYLKLSLFLFLLNFLLVFILFSKDNVKNGNLNFNDYIPLLKDKKIGVVANASSKIKNINLVDFLIDKKVNLKLIFELEHGFFVNKNAGEDVNTNKHKGIDVISLYKSKNHEPSSETLNKIDVLLFDIQDVGCRFYTYLSSLFYIMNASKKNNVRLIILDRPNPNDYFIDGPVLKKEFKSFVGIIPIPIVHAMTFGELALMIKGENWLDNVSNELDLKIIKCKQYTHGSYHILDVIPSPNLNNSKSIYAYPSITFFEGTIISEGRGTYKPFLYIGHPYFKDEYEFNFTPVSIENMSTNPKLKDQKCYGINLENKIDSLIKLKRISLKYLLEFYNKFKTKYPDSVFFKDAFFDKLAGTDELRKQIIENKTEEEIKKGWQKDLELFKEIRKKYLIYKDIESEKY